MRPTILVVLLGGAACGQTVNHDRCDENETSHDTICAKPIFGPGTLESSTRSLRLVIRQTNVTGDDCDDLWRMAPTALPQSEAIATFPVLDNKYPGDPIALERYDQLALLLYAYDEEATPGTPFGFTFTRPPIAGGCVVANIPPEYQGPPTSTPSLRVDVPVGPMP